LAYPLFSEADRKEWGFQGKTGLYGLKLGARSLTASLAAGILLSDNRHGELGAPG
jgi:hypothetical protein